MFTGNNVIGNDFIFQKICDVYFMKITCHFCKKEILDLRHTCLSNKIYAYFENNLVMRKREINELLNSPNYNF